LVEGKITGPSQNLADWKGREDETDEYQFGFHQEEERKGSQVVMEAWAGGKPSETSAKNRFLLRSMKGKTRLFLSFLFLLPLGKRDSSIPISP